MNTKKRKVIQFVIILLVVAMVVTMVMPAIMMFMSNSGASVYADGKTLSLKLVGGTSITEGTDYLTVKFNFTNNSSTDLKDVYIEAYDLARLKEDPYKNPSDKQDVKKGQTASFELKLSPQGLSVGSYEYKMAVYANGLDLSNETAFRNSTLENDKNNTDYSNCTYSFYVTEREKMPDDDIKGEQADKSKNPFASIFLETPQGSLVSGGVSFLNVKAKNTGSSSLLSMSVTLQNLPEGITLPGGSLTKNFGSVRTNETKTAEYQLQLSDKIKSGNYPITVSVTGNLANGASYSQSDTQYVKITGTEKKNQSGTLNITDVQIPKQAKAGEDFTMSFNVSNNSGINAEGIKISVEGTEGVMNKSKGIFVLNAFPNNTSKHYDIVMFSDSKTAKKNYPIKITVEPINTKEEETDKIIPSYQYTGIFIYGGEEKDDEKKPDGVKNPQIMVSKYSYGGEPIEAGQDFDLTVSLTNTSKKNLTNIKVTLTADEGVFVPVDSSNSFFIDNMAPKAVVSRTMRFSSKPSAEEKTDAINVDMSYEDKDGNALTAKDIISIPVIQKTQLDTGEVTAQGGKFTGEPISLTMPFFNKGKTVISNLTATAQGNFGMEEGSYFFGTLEPGKKDSYDFNITVNNPGKVKGIVKLSFEDVSGNLKTVTKDFEINVEEMPPMDPMDIPEDMPKPGLSKGKKIGIGAAIALIIVFIMIMRHRKKKKQAKELEIDE